MTEIIPAIIPQDFEDLREHISLVKDLVPIVQVDVCDGKFVPSKSWPYVGDHGEFHSISNEDEGLPFWQEVDIEVDLMVSHPQTLIESWIKAGVKRIVLHYESTPNLKTVLEGLREKYGYLSDVPVSLEFGVAFDVKTSNDHIHQFLDSNKEGRSLADFVQFMGIRKVGYQGESFVEEVLGKIRELRQSHPEAIISVDGGVTIENAHSIIQAGVNRLISGSAIFESLDVKEVIDEMRNI
jgi:ribulose-phosphate 3-epimerase